MNRKLTLSAIALALIAGLGLTGCGDKQTQPWQDAGRTGIKNNEPADIVTMPDGFNNLATKCDHGNRIYVTYHGDSAYGSVTVVPNDASCVIH